MGGSWATISAAQFNGARVRSRRRDLGGEVEFERSVGLREVRDVDRVL